ncbi:hypothetical protein TRFO_30819 [Tritrichomonas foetus]|uniref:Uncharacterized protein n=1 Tax=Tritrichomonas foetus TaxID=1144522 RepID=A0A1J4JSV5_9EUKA|nr:hypothetical protein TRFO_30819 [Tritrichomonas foetus]|eukprot:OHT02193.1 hypothetical protein TRFO_30819 [Tritrichomonas foetus]
MLKRFKTTVSRFFSNFPFTLFFQWCLFATSIAVALLIAPFSLLESNHQIQKTCNLERKIYITTNRSSILSNFTYFTSFTKANLDLVLSFDDKIETFPDYFNDTFEEMNKRGISIRVFTNNRNFSSKYAKIKYNQNSSQFFMNFAISDGIDIFFPSSFYDNSNLASISYIASLRRCNSAGSDLSALFDQLWHKSSAKIMKHSWIAEKSFMTTHSTKNLTFLIEPELEFPVGRPNITSTLYEAMSLTYMKKIVLCQKVFPDSPQKYAHESALISSLFDVLLTFIEDAETYLAVPESHFYDHQEAFRSMMSNMIDNGISKCNAKFDGTIIVSGSHEKSRLFLLPSGISEAYTGGAVLGLTIDYDDTEEIEQLLEELVNNGTCSKIPHPKLVK